MLYELSVTQTAFVLYEMRPFETWLRVVFVVHSPNIPFKVCPGACITAKAFCGASVSVVLTAGAFLLAHTWSRVVLVNTELIYNCKSCL